MTRKLIASWAMGCALAACAAPESVEVGPAEIHVSIVARAVVEPRDGTARVASPSTGRVVELFVEEGGPVAAGDQLAIIDSELMVGPTPIVSPISGTVLARHVGVGDDVSRADGAIFEIADAAHVRLRFELEDEDAPHVVVGAAVRVTAPGSDEVLSTSTVTRLAARMEPRRIGAGGVESTELVRAGWIEIEAQGALPIGREVEVAIALPTHAAALSVPHSAVAVENGQPVVHVPGALGDRVVPVVLGASDVEHVEILAGLGGGSMVRLSP